MRFVQNALQCLMPIPEQKKKCSQTAKFPKIRPVPPTPGPLHFEQALLQFLTILKKFFTGLETFECQKK